MHKTDGKMINTFKIHNFRGIKSLEIDEIKQLNLFLGYNNCGKSSVLEALYLFSDPSHPVNEIQINRARHYLKSDIKSLQSIFYGLDYAAPITLSGRMSDGETRMLEIKYYEHEPAKTDLSDMTFTSRKTNKIYGLENILHLALDGKEETYKFNVEPVNDSEAKVSSDKQNGKYEDNFNCGYMPPSSNPLDYINSFKEIVENKETSYIVKALHEIEPSLTGLTVIDNQIMADIGLDRLIPIQLLGDGIRKIFSIIIFIYQLKNGVVLLDEIDNGLHYKSMPTLWKTIIYLADIYNVQLFITTHNIDSIKALAKVLGKDCANFQSKCNIYTLRKKSDGDCLAVRSSYEQFDYMIQQEMELR